MINIGKVNQLTVTGEYPFGYALAVSGSPDETVTLPFEDSDEDFKPGDLVDVFIGTDDAGSLTASTRVPCALVGETRVMKAVGVAHFGAFFQWSSNKDLLVPLAQQEQPIQQGMRYVVHVFFDEVSGRILGSTRLHRFLNERPTDLQAAQVVDCLVYAKTDLGFKVVINEQYLGLIFHSEAFKPLKIGQQLLAVVKQVRPDGKVDVVLQRQDKEGRQTLQQEIIEDLQAHGGLSTLTDKSPPEDIYHRFNVSKAAYKKALGALFKQRRIVIGDNAIRLLEE